MNFILLTTHPLKFLSTQDYTYILKPSLYGIFNFPYSYWSITEEAA